MDFYTVKQAKARSVDFIRRFPVTEDQELRLQDTTVSRKLVVLAWLWRVSSLTPEEMLLIRIA